MTTTDIATVEQQPVAVPQVDEPIKLSPQQEAFCVAYLTVPDASAAYRQCYKAGKMKPETIWSEASRLMANPKVAARIHQLRNARAIPTLNSIVTDLEATRNGAWQDRNWSAARGSILGLARVSGHMKDDPTKVGDVHIHLTQIMAGVL